MSRRGASSFYDGGGREGDGANAFRVSETDREEMTDFLNVEEKVLPSQWRARATVESPERRLALSVFCQGIADLFEPGRYVPQEEWAANREDARNWLMSDDTSHLYSFASLADLFGFSVTRLRERLLDYLAQGKVPKLPRASELHTPKKPPRRTREAA